MSNQNSSNYTEENQFLERPMPHAAEAERTILGHIILDNSLMAEAVEQLQPEHFYVRANQLVFRGMISLFQKGAEINYLLLQEELRMEGILEQAGGLRYFSQLTHGLPYVSNLTPVLHLIRAKAALRQLIRLCNKATSAALEEEDTAEAIIEEHQQGVFHLRDENTTDEGFATAGQLAHASLERVHLISQHGNTVTGLSTGYTDLDAMTLGLQRTDLIIIAARTSIGKTSLSCCLVENAALDCNAKVAVFSLEMSKQQIINRFLCSIGRVDSHRYRSGYLNSEEWARLYEAEQRLQNAKIFIDDTPALNILRIKAKLRKLTIEYGQLDLIVIDYLQLMSGIGKRIESRQQEVSAISRDLKALAKEMNAPLIANAQLSRSPEQRNDHRPVLSDLRESGQIENDADLVAFIYRADKYKKPDEEKTNTAEIILSKHRNGPTGTILLRFEESIGRFDNFTPQEHSYS